MRSLKSVTVLASFCVACLVGGFASAQFWRKAPEPQKGGPPEAEFHMARLAYASVGCAGSRGWCNPWWAIDYPLAEEHFLTAVERMTRIKVSADRRHGKLDEAELFE